MAKWLKDMGLDGEYLEAVRALYAAVPMTVGISMRARTPSRAAPSAPRSSALTSMIWRNLPVEDDQLLPPTLFADVRPCWPPRRRGCSWTCWSSTALPSASPPAALTSR